MFLSHLKESKMFQLHIHGFGNENYLIDVSSDEESFNSMSVMEVKIKFLNETHVPIEPESLRFLFAG